MRTLMEGTPPPDWLLSDKGVRPEHFPDPAVWFERMIKGPPLQVIALYKQRLKMFKLGAVSGPLARGLSTPVFVPMPAPEFIIEEAEDKWRLIWDFSAAPTISPREPQYLKDFTINQGYARRNTSLSFPRLGTSCRRPGGPT